MSGKKRPSIRSKQITEISEGRDEFDQCRHLNDTGSTIEHMMSGTREVLKVLHEKKFLARSLARF